MKKTYYILTALCVVLCAVTANASTTTTTFQVTATVNNACTVSANSLNFGTYNPLAGIATDLSGSIGVTCTLGSAYQVGLNAGTGIGATVTTRKMTSGANTLNYSLYRDVAYTQNWGNTPGTDTLSGTGTGLSINYPVYGVLPASQGVPSGSYADTITVTVTY